MNKVTIERVALTDITKGNVLVCKDKSTIAEIKAIFKNERVEVSLPDNHVMIIDWLQYGDEDQGHAGVIDSSGEIWGLDINPVNWGVLYGTYFGYPECCIWGIHRPKVDSADKPARVHNALVGTGYVPCPKCSHREPADIVAEIQSRRKCKISFPNSHFITNISLIHYYQTDYVEVEV